MILSSTKEVGDTIKLNVNADEADRKDVWIDLNANGEKEEGEAVSEFNKSTAYSLGAQSIVVYGKIFSLECQKASLTQLDVSKNTALKILYCQDNNLTQLDISKNTELEYLHCQNNSVAALNTSKNTELRMLKCQNNIITQLDVSKNTALQTLHCQENNLSQLNLSKNPKLLDVICHTNILTELELSNNLRLMKIEIFKNSIKTTKMQHIVDALNNYSQGNLIGTFIVFDTKDPNEKNEITKKQVEELKAKKWAVWDANKNDYEGQ